jgi:methionine synthase II (cobalamin-independent)
VVDGEFRREAWWSEFIRPDCITGLSISQTDTRTDFDQTRTSSDLPVFIPKRIRTSNRLKRSGNIMGHAFDVMKSAATKLPKVTIPTPGRVHFQYGGSSVDPNIYPDIDLFWNDVVEIFQQEIADLEAAGCRSIQIDDPLFSYFIDPNLVQIFEEMGEEPAALLQTYIDVINRSVAKRRPDTAIGLHICRGNARGSWVASGGYEAIAGEVFPQLDADVYYLEYDDDRSGDFEPLRQLPADKKVVLGLVTTKHPEIEVQAGLIKRIEEAAKIIPLEQLAISPQCGFASVMEGNPISEEIQSAKLALVVSTAQEVWGTA